MLSDVTISFGAQSVTFPGLYLVIGCLIVLGLSGFIVAIAGSRRVERKTSEATEILVVQLERIGDALDRLVAQNAALAVNEPATNRPRDRFLAERAIPGRGTSATPHVVENGHIEAPAQKSAFEQSSSASLPLPTATVPEPKRGENNAEQQPAESVLSEPARSILYSMLGQ